MGEFMTLKTLKKQTPWYILLNYFVIKPLVTSVGRAEIENVIGGALFYVFNFSSATRECFSNVYTLLKYLATW